MQLDSNQKAIFELIRAGLWEKEAWISQFGKIDYMEVLRLAEDQSIVGLIAAGLEHVQDVKVPQEEVLQFVGSALQIEQQNMAMNDFVAQLIEKLRKEDVYVILVKGQGIAQCYERPLWRASGDVDLLLSDNNYEKAKKVLLPLAKEVDTEYKSLKHLGMTMKDDFVVELHGMLHSRLSYRIDKIIDETQNDVIYGGNVRSWDNNGTQLLLPSPDNDVIFVFTHILHHFYIEGIGLRQICDWCRLLWTYKDSLNHELLEKRIWKMGLMSEWKAFAAFAVEYLGMPKDEMPFFDVRGKKDDIRWKKKAEYILRFVLESGNFGHNRERTHGKFLSAWNKMKDFVRHVRIFPLDSIKFLIHFLGNGIQLAIAK